MAAASKREYFKSPQEIEEKIISTPTVTWDPFSVLPKEIYLKIFDKLDSPTDKENFMNAHVKFYDLFESNRTAFLFEKVLKEIVKKRVFWNFPECRLVCHDWDKGVQNFFQLDDFYFRIEDEERTFNGGYAYEPNNSFVWDTARKAENDLEKFSASHPPSKNPFVTRKVTLMSIFDVSLLDELAMERRLREIDRERARFLRRVDDLVDEELEEIEREFEGAETTERYRASIEAILDRYGRHIWHCKVEIKDVLNPEACQLIKKWLDLMPELKTLLIINEVHKSFSEMETDLKEIEDMELVPPELKNLVLLKSSRVPATAFNKLFGNVAVDKIQIDIKFQNGTVFRNFTFNRKNLKEAFFTLKGLDDYKYLEDSEAFPNLKKLVIALKFETEEESINRTYSFCEWKMIFKVLEAKFPALEELTLRPPKAVLEEDKRTVIEQILECQLNLPTLKKLWIMMPNLCSLDFIYPCRFLEELRVILERPEWDNQKYIGLRGIRWGEKLVFNVDLENMFEESIPRVFSKLREVNIWKK